jgi:gas vesicle protein
MKNNQVILGVVGGLAAGALLGILFAPNKGSKTRKKLLQKGEEYTDDFKHKLNDMYDTVANKYNGALKEAKDFADKATL